MKYQKGFAPLVIILLVVLGVGVVGGGYVVIKDKQEQEKLEAEIQILQDQILDSKKIDVNTEIKNSTSSLPAQAGLPAVVEAKRQAIYQAALSRDLGKLKSETSDANLSFYGFGTDGKFSQYGISGYTKFLEEEKKVSLFDLISTLLKLPYSVSNPDSIFPIVHNWWASENLASEIKLYTWPAVVIKSPQDLTVSDIANMKTFLSDEQIKTFREDGYSYFNIVITSEGKWISSYSRRD